MKVSFATIQVVDIMRVNVNKVLDRDQKLADLDQRAGWPTLIIYRTSDYFP